MIRMKKQAKMAEIDLDGPHGNAYFLLATAAKLAKEYRYTPSFQGKILKEMESSDYAFLLKTFEKYFGENVILLTSDKHLLKELKSPANV